MQTLYYSYKPEKNAWHPRIANHDGDQNKDEFVYGLPFDLLCLMLDVVAWANYYVCALIEKRWILNKVDVQNSKHGGPPGRCMCYHTVGYMKAEK